MELFYEESAKVQNKKSANLKYMILKIFSIVSYVVAGGWAIISFCTVDFGQGGVIIKLLYTLLPVIIFIVLGIVSGLIKNRFYIDYDYTFISGEVRISKVIKEIKRYDVLSFDTKNIEKIGKYDSQTYKKYDNTPGITKKIFTSNIVAEDEKDFFYMVVNKDGKNLYIFECTEKFITSVLKFSNRNVIEEDYK